MTKDIKPVDPSSQAGNVTVVHSTVTDSVTGARWVHKDLVQVLGHYENEAHIAPMNRTEKFGDVQSWATFVKSYGNQFCALLTWNAQGLRAVLDYYNTADGRPGRCQWLAAHPFTPSLQWRAWTGLANGQVVSHKLAVESLEDLAGDIVEPEPSTLMIILRSLRASVNAKADAELRPDGSTAVSFQKDTQVKSFALELPAGFGIAIPVLKGHLDAETHKPAFYRLDVRLRVSVDDAAHLGLRFSMPNVERVLESVYEERVGYAQELLGEEFDLLRAAD